MTRDEFIAKYAKEGLAREFDGCVRRGCKVFEFHGIDWVVGLEGIYPEREVDEKKLKEHP